MKKKPKKRISIYDADHPYRQSAINIIERVIEPILQRPLDGEQYYSTEDNIVDVLRRNKPTRKTVEFCTTKIIEVVIRPHLIHGIEINKYIEATKNIKNILRRYCLNISVSLPDQYDDEEEPEDHDGFNPFESNDDDDDDDDDYYR